MFSVTTAPSRSISLVLPRVFVHQPLRSPLTSAAAPETHRYRSLRVAALHCHPLSKTFCRSIALPSTTRDYSSSSSPRQQRELRRIIDKKLNTRSNCHRAHQRASLPSKSQFSPIYLFIGVAIGLTGSLVIYFSSNIETPVEGEVTEQPHEIERKAIISSDNMVSLPGRPGNLTPEEEAKLKQFWRMTFNVTGVECGDGPLIPDTASTINTDGQSISGKSRKSGFFRRKETAPADEDKYGQSADFKEALRTTSPDEFRQAFWANAKNEHPDAVLLRFLRARKWDLQKALVMMISTLQWRKKTMKIEEEIVFKGELSALEQEKYSDNSAVAKEATDFLSQIRKGKSYVHGVDKEGRPVTWVRVRLHHGGEQSDTSIERFTVQIFETTRLLIEPPADTGDLFFDMSGFSMANMDYTPVKFMIRCFEANYPESLGVCLIYKAPWIFQGVWKIISRWLDPVVASKIHFTNNIKDLDPYVDRSQVPQEMGGDSPYEYHYIEPVEGENDLMKDTATRKRLEADRAKLGNEFERLTIAWINGENVNAQRHQMAAKLKEEYWKLDPYIRARTLYDRLGVLGRDGTIDWSKAIHPNKYQPPSRSVPPAGATVAPADDSDNESIASFHTAEQPFEDEQPKPNGVTVVGKTPNGTAIDGPSHNINGSPSRGMNGVAKTGITAAASGAAIGAVVNARKGSLGKTNGTSRPNSIAQPPVTPSKKMSTYQTIPPSPARSNYSHAGTQTWNPRDASTQTMPQHIPHRGR